jgi:hypothetical protein
MVRVYRLIVRPIVRAYVNRRSAKVSRIQAEELQSAKTKALHQQEIMGPVVARTRAAEEDKNGLIIVRVR